MKCVDTCFHCGGGDAAKQAEVSLLQIALECPDSANGPNNLMTFVSDGGHLHCTSSDSDSEDSITVDPPIDPAPSDANNIGELSNVTVTPNAPHALQQLQRATRVTGDSKRVLSSLNCVDGLVWNMDEDMVQMDVNGRALTTAWSI